MEFAQTYKKDDETSDFPFQNLTKIQVLQEARHEFGNPNANPKKSAHLIAKLLYVIGQGQTLTEDEAQDIYVQSTMLFMNPDQKLRRMLYLIIKELSETSEEAYMAVNSLSNDMTKGDHKANAIRALRTIADLSTFTALDRHLEQSLVDKDSSVATAALLSALHLSDMNPEVVRRWQNKIQSAMMSSSHMVQYHALAVMYKLRHTDLLAVSKLVSASTSGFKSPLAHSLLIRYATRVLASNGAHNSDSDRNKTILKYLNACLSYKNEVISIDAAKAMCSLPFLTASQITPAVTALQSILHNYSNRPVHRFAAIRILNQLSDRFPDLVQMCQENISDLIDDPNRNIATLAITTLLKSGAVTSIEKLLKQITSFMSNISDEFKIFVVEAMQLLIQKYPSKHMSIIKFLNEVLRDEGGYEFKRMIVDTMISVIRAQGSMAGTETAENAALVKDTAIAYLCDFIEDCEFTVLLQRILHFLGKEGPTTKNPSQCIRYIYNRIILENPAVRATAVVTLSKFAAAVPSLKDSVLVLLRRSLQDTDDEVRDRAVACIESLTDSDLTESILSEDEDEDIDALDMEASLLKYIGSGATDQEFNLSMVKPKPKPAAAVDAAAPAVAQVASTAQSTTAPVEAASLSTLSQSSKIFSKIPFLKKLGKPFKSSDIIHLTEADSDYVVNCVKHIFPSQVVFQFLVKNQVEEHILEDVEMSLGDLDSAEGFNVDDVKVIPASKPIRFQQSENILVCVPREEGTHPTGQFPITMTFKTRVFDVESQEEEDDVDEDELELEEVKVSIGDYMVDETGVEFRVSWDEAGAEQESSEVIDFSHSESLQEALIRFEAMLGLTSLVSTQVPEGKRAHNIFFCGKLDTDSVALVAASMRDDTKRGCILLQLSVRSEDEELREKILASVTQ